MSTVGYKCPLCGSDALQIKKEVWCHISQSFSKGPNGEPDVDITLETPLSGGVIEDTDDLYCGGCGYNTKSTRFEWSEGPEGTITVNAEKDVP